MPPVVEHPAELNGMTTDAWALDLFTKLSLTNPKVLFRKDGPERSTLFVANGHEPPREVSDARTLEGEIYNLVSFYKDEIRNNAPVRTPALINPITANRILCSEYKRLLPEITSITLEPAAVLINGKPVLSNEGYDERTKIFFYNKSGLDWKIGSGCVHLKKCFESVPFERQEFRNNVIASLLGAIIIDSKITSPLLCVVGNQPGVGKTVLSTALGYILTGREPSPVNFHPGELEKDIGARFKKGNRYILVDNVVADSGKGYRNDRLATLVTQGHSKSVRELGFSRSVGAEGVLFTMTMNHCVLHEDLAVRALMCKLFKERTGPMATYVLAYAKDHRKELFEELLGILNDDELPPFEDDLYPTFRFRSWLRLVYPRVLKYFGPMAPVEGLSLDEATQDFFSWVETNLQSDKEFTVTVEKLVQLVSMPDISGTRRGITDYLRGAHTVRGKATKLGTFLKNLVNKTLPLNREDMITMRVVSAPTVTPIIYGFKIHSSGAIDNG
jgi:hypothetical protein